MLIDHFGDIKRILIGYQFHFGIGTLGGTKILDCSSGQSCTLKDISNGCYRISNDKVSLCPQPDRQLQPDEEIIGKFIVGYKKNVNRRIRTSYRGVRDSLVIKLDDFPISSLSVDNKPVKNQSIQLSGIITIQNIGICSISLWFEGYTPQTEKEWRSVCDSALVSFTLTHTNLTRSTWQLNDFVRFLSLKCHKVMNPKVDIPATVENNEIIKGWDNFSTYLKKEYKKCSEEPISYNVESYPIVFIHYNLETSAINSMFETPSEIADARLVLNGDLHWKFKTDSVIEDTINDIDVRTRSSIHWMVAPQGTLKVCSQDLEVETSVEESFTVALLETDLILTMRYFLSAIMQNLSELTKKFDDPIKVANMKDHIFTTMDKYFNINISQNDQTIRRIKKFKKIFHVDDTYKNVTDRLEILSVKTSNENSAVIEKQQIFLTIIFGLFGSLQVLYPFFQKLFENTGIADIWVFFISFTTSAIIAGIIYYIVKKIKYNKKHIF